MGREGYVVGRFGLGRVGGGRVGDGFGRES